MSDYPGMRPSPPKRTIYCTFPTRGEKKCSPIEIGKDGVGTGDFICLFCHRPISEEERNESSKG
jgi:hypothetical protein